MGLERRWIDGIHFKPDGFRSFWAERVEKKRDILIIAGLGWDPRTAILAKVLREFGGEGVRQLHLICYKPSKSFVSPHQKFIARNAQEMKNISNDWAEIKEILIITRKEGNLYIGDTEISNYYLKFDITCFSDIIVDISSLPKSLYFTLLLVLVSKSMKQAQELNVHIVACQDVDLDNKIIESTDDVRLLKGFKATLETISKQNVPKIWAPILSKSYSGGLGKLYDKIIPMDIYPILPFPTKNPRTDDDLLVEYRKIFLDEWNINPLNIIYAAEDDPFDVYRSLLKLFQQQKEALLPLGDITMVVSALSSKLSSIGIFMAAFGNKMAVMHAIGRHNPPDTMDFDFWSDPQVSRASCKSLAELRKVG